MTALYLYDDAVARDFEPFASTRPISTMLAGTEIIRERWTQAVGATESFFLAGPRHLDFDEPFARLAAGVIPAGSIVANVRCVPMLGDIENAHEHARRFAACTLWRCGGELAAVRLRENVPAERFDDGTLTLEELHAGTGSIGELGGWWLNAVWDFVRLLPEQLASDIASIGSVGNRDAPATTPRDAMQPPAHATVIGSHAVLVAGASDAGALHGQLGAVIEPLVVLDASAGPIFIGAGAHVRAFTRITGPCYIGPEVQVMGGDITGCAVGRACKVRGELSNTLMLGYSNKGHDGFVGHSYLGRWVNLGAGTITSNLKNTYGPVALWTPAGLRDTGMQFLGTLFGDHVKTGIGLRLTTGTVLGAGANVYDTMPPKVVAPFSWGGAPPYATYRADKFLETAARMMSRRHVELTDRARRHLTAVHTGRWTAEMDDR